MTLALGPSVLPGFPMPMVSVVQLVEHQVVILAVAGSSPVAHPSGTPENVGRHFRGFFWFVRQPQSPLPQPGGVATATNRSARATRARAERTYLSSPQIDRKPLSLTSGWPERRKSPTRRSLGRRFRLPDTYDGPLANMSLVHRNLVVDDVQVFLHRSDPGSNQLLMRL